MSTKQKSPANEIYQIEVTLLWTEPPIWRRLLVPADLTLAGLHNVIQCAMGWEDDHLHEFKIRGMSYGGTSPHGGYFELESAIDERKVPLHQVFSRNGAKASYIYDFGDNWEHRIVFEKRLPADPNTTYPVCTGGERACPPEDCGGISGYYRLMEERDPEHELHEEYLMWVGEEYDPEAFSAEKVNAILQRRKRRATS